MIKVPLSRGRFALIDDEDAERVLAFKWCYYRDARRKNGNEYAIRVVRMRDATGKMRRTAKKSSIRLHRFILDAPQGVEVDHKDGDGLNCQRFNMRLATRSQNTQNSKTLSNNTSGFKGVVRMRRNGKWRYEARIKSPDGTRHYLGVLDDPVAAAHIYDARAREMFGEFARLNFPRAGEQGATR